MSAFSISLLDGRVAAPWSFRNLKVSELGLMGGRFAALARSFFFFLIVSAIILALSFERVSVLMIFATVFLWRQGKVVEIFYNV